MNTSALAIHQLTIQWMARDVWQDKMDLIDKDAKEALGEGEEYEFARAIIQQLGIKPVIDAQERNSSFD